MHQALAEDVITQGNQYPDTPAYAFAALNYEKVDQAFRPWLLHEAQYLDRILAEYRKNRERKFTLTDFKNKYLQAPPSIDVIYLLAYIVARLIRLETLPPYLLSSPFTGQLLQNLLFDLVQVVDVTIAEKNKSKWKMIDHVNFLSKKSGEVISMANLEDVNRRFRTGYEKTLNEILDGAFKFKDGTPPSPIQSDLLVLYGLRNQAAHGVSSAAITWQRFDEIRNAVFNTLFLAAEILF